MSFSETLASGAVIMCIPVLVVGGMYQLLVKSPDLHYSSSLQECVKIVEYNKDGSIVEKSCDEIPKRYNLVWVK